MKNNNTMNSVKVTKSGMPLLYMNGDFFAVIISRVYGGEWASYGEPLMMYDYDLASALIDYKKHIVGHNINSQQDCEIMGLIMARFATAIKRILDLPDFFMPMLKPSDFNINSLEVVMVNKNDRFYIHEYDGKEEIRLKKNFKWAEHPF